MQRIAVLLLALVLTAGCLSSGGPAGGNGSPPPSGDGPAATPAQSAPPVVPDGVVATPGVQFRLRA